MSSLSVRAFGAFVFGLSTFVILALSFGDCVALFGNKSRSFRFGEFSRVVDAALPFPRSTVACGGHIRLDRQIRPKSCAAPPGALIGSNEGQLRVEHDLPDPGDRASDHLTASRVDGGALSPILCSCRGTGQEIQ
jgi:hypothetical protein